MANNQTPPLTAAYRIQQVNEALQEFFGRKGVEELQVVLQLENEGFARSTDEINKARGLGSQEIIRGKSSSDTKNFLVLESENSDHTSCRCPGYRWVLSALLCFP